jgi:hypothetical protein
MGGFEKWRNFLLNLFLECFMCRLPPGTTFDLGIVDLMQYLTGRVLQQKPPVEGLAVPLDGEEERYALPPGGFDVRGITQRIARAVAHHQNNEEDPGRPLLATGLVCLLDTVHHVPKNKAAKQRTRGRTGGDGPVHLTGEKHQQLIEKYGSPPLGLFIRCGDEQSYPLDGQTVWRSVNLKLQLYRAVTRQVLEAPVPEGKILLLDDGLQIPTDELEKERATLVEKYGLEGRDSFEQESIIAQLLTYTTSKDGLHFIRRLMKGNNGPAKPFGPTCVGEADIKVQSYISPSLGVKRFLAINQDTDVIFILLLHMRSLLYGDERDDELEVWLDMRCPGDKHDVERAYRYVNIKKLYYAITSFFREEFPSVKFPVETLCLLVFSLETDYTRKFHSCLGIGERTVWDAFSEMHSVHKEGFVTFVDKPTGQAGRIRRKQRRFPTSNFDLLAQAVQYKDSAQRFILDHARIARFYFLLIQQSLTKVRQDLGLCCSGGELQPLEVDELRIYAKDVAERVRAHRKDGSTQTKLDEYFRTVAEKRTLEEEPPPKERQSKKPKVEAKPGEWTSTRRNTSKKNEEISTLLKGIVEVELVRPVVENMDIITLEEDEEIKPVAKPEEQNVGIGMACYLVQNQAALRRVAKNAGDDEYFNVPSPAAMLARIYRIEWYLAYCRNGWKSNNKRGTMDYRETSAVDPSLSMWGWKEKVLDLSEEGLLDAMNCTYYQAQWAPEMKNLFRLSTIEETDEVSHQRYG